MNSTPPQPQRQDSLHEQMRDVVRAAEQLGCYDAADWIKDRWNGFNAPYEHNPRRSIVRGTL